MAYTLLMLAAGLLAGVVLLEGLARLIVRRSRYYPWPPGHRLEMELDARLVIGEQKIVRLETNERGERGRSVDRGAFQVLAMGGSAVECYLLDEPSTWTAALERALQAGGKPRVHVGNAGKSSVDSYVLARMIRYMAPNYPERVDVLLLMVGASDILRWLEAGAPEAWEGDRKTALEAFLEINPETKFGWWPRQFAMAEMRRRWRSSRPAKRSNVGKSLLKARQYRQQCKKMLDQTADPGAMFGRFRQYLGESIRQGKAAMAKRVIVVSQPCFARAHYSEEELAIFWNGAIGDPYQGEPSGFYTAPLIAGLMEQLRDHTKAVAAAEGVEFVDSSGAIPGDREHYYDQFHFTPRGAARLGEWLARVIAPGQ